MTQTLENIQTPTTTPQLKRLEHISGVEVEDIKVYRTQNLEQFQFMETNRPVSERRTNKIMRELVGGNDLLRHYPIQVTKDGYVIDGQHRLQAARKAKDLRPDIAIYFFVRDTTSEEMAEELETMSLAEMMMIRHNILDRKNWSYGDFLLFWASKGNHYYEAARDLIEAWNDTHEKNIAVTGFLRLAGSKSKQFKEGKLIFDIDEVESMLTEFDEIYPYCHDIVSAKSIDAYLKVRELPKFDFQSLLNGLKNYSKDLDKIEGFKAGLKASSPHYRNMALISVHNFGLTKKNRIQQVPLG